MVYGILALALTLNTSSFQLNGDFRFASGYVSNPSATKSIGDKEYGQIRFRLDPSYHFSKSLTFYSSFDLASNVYYGGKGFDTLGNNKIYSIRRIYLKFLTPFGLFEVGRMPNHWGMGILVNHGDGYDDVFGINRYGDSVDRIVFGTKPLGTKSSLLVAIGYDKVAEEKIFSQGDDADDWLAVIFYDGKKLKGGAYVVTRIQYHTDTLLVIPDLYFNLNIKGEDIRLSSVDGINLSLEGVVVLGNTKAAPPVIGKDYKREVFMTGLAGKLGLVKSFFEFNLEGGFASGDANPLGGKITSFTFNPDYNVGILMFEEVLNYQTLNSKNKLLANVGYAPDVELFHTRGGVTNAFYFFPYINFYLLSKKIKLTAAFLYARAVRNFVDPYYTAIYAGKSPVGFGGGPPGKNYGIEYDFGVEWRISNPFWIKFEYGVLLPGDVFGEDKKIVSGGNLYLIVEF